MLRSEKAEICIKKHEIININGAWSMVNVLAAIL